MNEEKDQDKKMQIENENEEPKEQDQQKTSFTEFVAMLMQDYDKTETYMEKYEKFVKKYQADPIFAQLVWVCCNLDKGKNTFDQLIEKAILGKQIKAELPIMKANFRFKYMSKLMRKQEQWLASYNLKYERDDDDEEEEDLFEQKRVDFGDQTELYSIF